MIRGIEYSRLIYSQHTPEEHSQWLAKHNAEEQRRRLLHEQECNKAIEEAEKLRVVLEKRRLAREENAANIEARLASGVEVIKSGHRVKRLTQEQLISVDPTDGSRTVTLSDEQKTRLQNQLDLLRTYDTRLRADGTPYHPVGDAAVQKHVWIKFGLNYEVVMQHRAAKIR